MSHLLNEVDSNYNELFIVYVIQVIFTLLQTDGKHLSEVYTKENVEEKANIYYSKPKDILKKEDRDQLMEAFIRLNNV